MHPTLVLLAQTANDHYAKAAAHFRDAADIITNPTPSGVPPGVGLMIAAAVLLFGFMHERGGAGSKAKSSSSGGVSPLVLVVIAVAAFVFLRGGLG